MNEILLELKKLNAQLEDLRNLQSVYGSLASVQAAGLTGIVNNISKMVFIQAFHAEESCSPNATTERATLLTNLQTSNDKLVDEVSSNVQTILETFKMLRGPW